MKYLNDYTKDATTKLFEDNGAFFAFSDKQLDEQKKEGVVYVSMGAGFVCPKNNALALHQGLRDVMARGISADIAENGKEAIIERELSNHEAYYTGDLENTFYSLGGYGFTIEDVRGVYTATKANHL